MLKKRFENFKKTSIVENASINLTQLKSLLESSSSMYDSNASTQMPSYDSLQMSTLCSYGFGRGVRNGYCGGCGLHGNT